MHAPTRIKGLTLIELIVAIAVMAILLTLGVPSIQETIKNNRVAAQNNELVAMLSFTKSEAVRRNATVTAEFTADMDGWSGRVLDPDGDGAEPCVSEGALRCTENTKVQLSGDPLTLSFNNRGYLELAGAWEPRTLFLEHEGCNGQRQHRQITILPTGQISSTAVPCNDNSEPST